MDNLKTLFSEEILQMRINELAKQIDSDYKGKELVVVSILKGAIYFTADLTKKMKTPILLQTFKAHSYEGTESTGNVVIQNDLDINIAGKDVLIVEDIIDSGRTLDKVRNYMLSKNPNSLKFAVLLDKKDKRVVNVPVDYIGFDIPNKFIIGYGFDYDEKYINIPYI